MSTTTPSQSCCCALDEETIRAVREILGTAVSVEALENATKCVKSNNVSSIVNFLLDQHQQAASKEVISIVDDENEEGEGDERHENNKQDSDRCKNKRKNLVHVKHAPTTIVTLLSSPKKKTHQHRHTKQQPSLLSFFHSPTRNPPKPNRKEKDRQQQSTPFGEMKSKSPSTFITKTNIDQSDCRYEVLATAFEALEKTRSRKLITQILADTLVHVLEETQNLLSATPTSTASSATSSTTTHPHHNSDISIEGVHVVADVDALVAAVYLSTNAIAPSYENVELNVGSSIMTKAISNVSGKNRTQLRALFKKYGDLGDVAAHARASQQTLIKPKPLYIKDVFQQLHSLAETSGKGSVGLKTDTITKLLLSCQGNETKFIVRTLIANLRVGAVGLTLQSAVARAIVQYRKLDIDVDEAATLLKSAYARCPSWRKIITCLLRQKTHPFSALAIETEPSIGIPLRNMLANITKDIHDAIAKMKWKDFQAEYKYDGVRAQIHIEAKDRARDSVKLFMFSRHLENVTDRYPDAFESVLDSLSVTSHDSFASSLLRVNSCILDAEIVAVDPETHSLLPFQTLMSRPKKHVSVKDLTVSVCVFVYDLLFLNGKSLIECSLRERCKRLHELVAPLKGRCELVTSKTFAADISSRGSVDDEPKRPKQQSVSTSMSSSSKNNDVEAENTEKLNDESIDELREVKEMIGGHNVATLRDFFHGAVKSKCEGIMIKALGPPLGTTPSASEEFAQSTYQPSKRCENWLKVKKDYVDGIGDTLDLVVIGGWWGMGRKAGWLSPFLLACYDNETDSFQSVCKVMSGFTDEFYKKATDVFLGSHQLETKRADYIVDEKMTPSIWLAPVKVWEIKGADFTQSPVHTACRGLLDGSPTSGVSVRFPRFVRERDDKSIRDATTSEQIAQLYLEQFK
eukprot:m.128568 g.128568  ORF g.128568 m.128568 type:complete len:915 (-) comp13033_c0_seq1:161-2905(-)